MCLAAVCPEPCGNFIKASWKALLLQGFGNVQVTAELAGVPERADWKKCMISPDEEAARTEKFKAQFKPYDIMQ